MENLGKDKWPVRPYKGLSSYGPEDAPLFAGRTADVELCADLLAARSTRIMILHGVTGCGKTSFLRAGLIPYLETDTHRFEFIKDEDGPDFKALFIRSTENPLVMMAQAIYEFAAKDIPLNSFLGKQTLELSRAVADYHTSTEFLRAVSEQPEFLVRALRDIAEILPKTLVLVLDQAEELLTLKPHAEGDSYRKGLFDFVSLFSETQFDLKLIITFRTEFYGRFIGECKLNSQSRTVTHYLLKELTDSQLIEAIERPTSTEDLPGFGKAFDSYGFRFEAELPRRIVGDLKTIQTAGAKLSLLQLTCDNLYQFAERRTDTVTIITSADYEGLRGIEGQIEGNIDRAIELVWNQLQLPRLPWQNLRKETYRWKGVLSTLAKDQADGTVTTEIIRAEALEEKAQRTGCVIQFHDLAEYLSRDEVRLLRRVPVIDFKTGKAVSAFSLGHDAVGLALKTWGVKSEEEKTERRWSRIRWTLPAIALLVILVSYLATSPQVIEYLVASPTVLALTVVTTVVLLALIAYSRRALTTGRDYQYVSSLHRDYPADLRLSFWWLSVRVVIPMAAAFIGFCQTSYFGRFLPGFDQATILSHISSCRALQQSEVRKGIVFEDFDPKLEIRLRTAIRSFHDDVALNEMLKLRFGEDVNDLNAVIVPSWKITSEAQADLYGITLVGWTYYNTARKTDYVGAYTLRNRPGEPNVTKATDGRPRIILNPSAFQSESALRFTLFHELLHALNIPGRDPPWYFFAQDDLRYLKEYREEVNKRGWIASSQISIWSLAVLLPMGIGIAQIRYAYAYFKTRPRSHD